MVFAGEIKNFLKFLKEADHLKRVERQTLLHNGGRRENSAEHSWHLALAVLVFEKLAPQQLDIGKALKIALLHDIAEIYVGDTIVYEDHTSKKEDEAAALKRLTNLLPEELKNEFILLWIEFEERISPEAKFVSAIDRFLPIFSNYLNMGFSWRNYRISSHKIIFKCRSSIIEGCPALWEVVEHMLEESISRGHLSRS